MDIKGIFIFPGFCFVLGTGSVLLGWPAPLIPRSLPKELAFTAINMQKQLGDDPF